MKKFLTEFKEFALRGNVMNLAVGVIIGGAFQGVVKSLTDNILSPIIGLFTGQNFDNLELAVVGVVIKYGAFLTSVINFFIMAFVVFLLVKGMNRIVEPKVEAKKEPQKSTCPYCLSEINKAATRCPACTSKLEAKTSK